MLRRIAVLVALLGGPVHFSSTIALAASPQQDARTLLNRWLEDQNTGDFADYQKLYADDFRGVRRSGPKSVTLDRTGWLADRQRMFGKKMTVEAENVRVFAAPASARVIFIQHWASGTYSDVGPKQLLLRHRASGYEIVREELFASDTRKSSAIDVAALRRFAFVIKGEVVISMHPDEGWATGPAKIDKDRSDRFLVRVRRQVDPKKLPPEVAQLVGSPVRLMDARGVRCEATLGGFLLRSQQWGDADDDDEPPQWSSTANFLVATVEGDRKACAGATWARSAALPAPIITAAAAPPPDLKARALAAFRALPENQAIQRRFATWSAHQGHKSVPSWFDRRTQHPTVRLLNVKPNGPVLLSVSATVNEGGCEDGVLGSLWALWQVEGPAENPRLVLRNQPDESMTMNPTAAVDVDGDGQAELLFDGFSDYASGNIFGQPQIVEHGMVRVLDGSYVVVDGPEMPILICPC